MKIVAWAADMYISYTMVQIWVGSSNNIDNNNHLTTNQQ